MWVQSLGRDDPLRKEVATHSSILAGKSHGQRGLVGLQWAHRAAKSWTQLSNLAREPELLFICQLLASALHYANDI